MFSWRVSFHKTVSEVGVKIDQGNKRLKRASICGVGLSTARCAPCVADVVSGTHGLGVKRSGDAGGEPAAKRQRGARGQQDDAGKCSGEGARSPGPAGRRG